MAGEPRPRRFTRSTELPLGALREPSRRSRRSRRRRAPGEIAIAVVGAHLSGMPLNGELRALNARFRRGRPTTAPDYRLYALAGHDAAEARPAARRRRQWRADRARDLGADRRRLSAASSPRSRRRCRSARSRLADGRQVQGLPGRSRRRSRARAISRISAAGARCGGNREGSQRTVNELACCCVTMFAAPPILQRLHVGLVFLAHREDMGAHRVGWRRRAGRAGSLTTTLSCST